MVQPAILEKPLEISCRTLRDRKPEIGWMLENEDGRDDIIDPSFFDQMARRPVTEFSVNPWPFPTIRFPMPYTDCSMISATFTVPVEEAQALLPDTERFKIVRLTPGKTPITFFGYDFRRGALGPYRELGVAIPVVLDGRLTPPLLPAVLENRYPGFGVFIAELPVNHARPCDCGVNLCGLPKVVGECDFSIESDRGSIGITYEGKKMADIRVALKGKVGRPRIVHRTVSCLQALNGRIVKSEFVTIGEGYRKLSGRAEVAIGAHPRFAKFRNLSLSSTPMEVMVLRRYNWIIWAPEDLGAL